MSTWIWVALGTVVVGFVAAGARGDQIKRAMKVARRTGEVADLVAAIEATPGKDRATRWDQAISDLWQGYHREAAAKLVVEAVQRSDADIIHYWIQRVLEVEPEVAADVFTREFIADYFRPQVAARCGKAGCGCG